MKKMDDFFPVGATYAPLPKATEVDIAEWPKDLATFKQLGLNTFRLFICHDRVERRRGERDFSRIDRAFELAAENNLKVIANVGGTFSNLQAIYPPRWLWYDKHCTLLKPAPDAPEIVQSNRFKLCYDDPVYQEETRGFIQEAIRRYRNLPELIAWSGWNEPRLSECFCRHSIALFREWLQKKYGDLAALEQAWSTEFPVHFRTWEDVFPQPKAGFEFGGYAPFLDWYAFREQNRRDKFHLVRNWIREIDPDTPVISHLCTPYHADIFGEEEILGTSISTSHAQVKKRDWDAFEFTTRQRVQFLASGRRSHRADYDGFWVVETEGGPVTWVHDLVPRSYSPRKHNARDMFFVANGARALLRWLYRSRVSDAQAGEFNLAGWDGRVTGRATEFGKLADFLTRNAGVMSSHHSADAGVYLWDSRDANGGFAECEGYQNRYSDGIAMYLNALNDIGVTGELCNTRQIREGILAKAKILIAPFCPQAAETDLAILRSFVERGGTLLAESPFATKNLTGIHYRITPGLSTDLFGAQVYDMEKLQDGLCGGIVAYDFKAHMEVTTGAVEGRFSDGEPAIVSNRYGKGLTVLYGSVLGCPYTAETGEALREELKARLASAGITPAWEVRGLPVERAKHIQVIPRLLPEGGRLLFVLNMDDRPNVFRVSLPSPGEAEELGSSDAPGGNTGDGREFRFNLGAWGWSVWQLRRHGE